MLPSGCSDAWLVPWSLALFHLRQNTPLILENTTTSSPHGKPISPAEGKTQHNGVSTLIANRLRRGGAKIPEIRKHPPETGANRPPPRRDNANRDAIMFNVAAPAR